MSDRDITNEVRVERARQALEAYVLQKGEVFEGGGTEAADLIADLLHFVSRKDNNPAWGAEGVIRLARMHFEAEHNNPEEMGMSAMDEEMEAAKRRTGI